MPKFRSKPREIDAEQFVDGGPLPFQDRGPFVQFVDGAWSVITAHGQRAHLQFGDWVVPEPMGPGVPSFAAYPIKPEIFAATYELVVDRALCPFTIGDKVCIKRGARDLADVLIGKEGVVQEVMDGRCRVRLDLCPHGVPDMNRSLAFDELDIIPAARTAAAH